jgi:2-polyprenyl-3-methyl-5-hydroxy-6-metoxy-1,4-benzoquinol methylase
METVNCLLCGSQNYILLLKTKDFTMPGNDLFSLVKCARCGFIYLNPMPNQETIRRYYDEKYFESSNLGRLSNEIYRLQIARVFLQLKHPTGKALDVGCGDGSLLFIMKEYGWDVYGVDISDSAVKLAKEKLGTNNIFAGRLEDCRFPSAFFDIISLRHVLEHLNKPYDTLVEIKRILKKDGILSITVPNIDSIYFHFFKKNWFHLDIPRHLYQFSARTLKDLLNKAGFKIIKRGNPLEDPLDLFRDLLQSVGIRPLVLPKRLLPAVSILAQTNLPFSYMLSVIGRGTAIQVFAKPK